MINDILMSETYEKVTRKLLCIENIFLRAMVNVVLSRRDFEFIYLMYPAEWDTVFEYERGDINEPSANH